MRKYNYTFSRSGFIEGILQVENKNKEQWFLSLTVYQTHQGHF